MAGKLVVMSKIKQLLRLHQSGSSNREIARELGIDKGTVCDYIRKLKTLGITLDDLLLMDDPVLEGKFTAGTAAYTDKRFDDLKAMLPWLEKELGRKHVTRHLLWQEYLTKYPSGYRYTQFCFHLNQLQIARKPTAVLTHAAGEKLFVDFAGDTMTYIDIHTGEVITVQVFVACLPFSDYSFVMCVESQKTEDFLYALTCCLRALGGSPKILVPDNLKAAVVKADRYQPTLNRVMEDFANHYNMVVLPARAGHPRDKAKVENQVQIIYSRVYAKLRNHRFFSLDELNGAVSEKTLEHNQTRMQRSDYTREEKFLADEKHTLRALPPTDFEMKFYAELRVGTNNCIYLGRDKHYYSVPYIHTGQKVQVIYTRTIVKIYCQNQCVATHSRDVGLGYSLVKEHLCSTHQHYTGRNPDYYIQTAGKKSDALAEVFSRIFESPQSPEVFYRTCDGLLSLCRKTDPERFEKACRIALAKGMFGYNFIKALIEGKSLIMEAEQTEKCPLLPFPEENIRGKDYYQ